MSKKARWPFMDTATAYAFRKPWGVKKEPIWFNKKATTITEMDDHLKIEVSDWYIDVNHKRYGEACIERHDALKLMSRRYENGKQEKPIR